MFHVKQRCVPERAYQMVRGHKCKCVVPIMLGKMVQELEFPNLASFCLVVWIMIFIYKESGDLTPAFEVGSSKLILP